MGAILKFTKSIIPFIIVACFGGQALAQVAGTSLPTREQVDIPKPNIDQKLSSVRIENRNSRIRACAFEKSELLLTLDRVNFVQSNAEPLPQDIAVLLSDIKPKQGKQSVASLCELRDEAAARLSDAGYIGTVTIPEQNILKSTSSADLMVVLGKLVDVTVSGGDKSQSDLIRRRMSRLKGVTPLRTSDIERELLLASDNPAINVQMNLKSANTNPGEIIGVISLTRKTHSLVANIQNYGSKTIGRETASIRAEYYGLLNGNDVAFVGASTTLDFDEQKSIQGGYYTTFDNDLKVGGSLTYGWSDPDLGSLDFRAKSLIGAVDLSYPLMRSVGKTLYLNGGLEIIEQEATLRGGPTALPLTKDKLRVAYLSLAGSLEEIPKPGGQAWSIGGNISYRQGLDVFDATERGAMDEDGFFPSRAQGKATASVFRAGLDTRYWPSQRVSLSASLRGQISSAPLLAFEEFSVGNLTLGRGYNPGATSGDEAIGLRVEPAVILPLKSSNVSLQAFGFGDIVRIWNKDDFTLEDGRSLRSVGGGVRAIVNDRFTLGLMYAHTLDPELNLVGAEDAPDRLLASVTFNFGAR